MKVQQFDMKEVLETVGAAGEAALSRPMVHPSEAKAKAYAVCGACGEGLEVSGFSGLWVVDPCEPCTKAAQGRELAAWRDLTSRAWRDKLVALFGPLHVDTRVDLLPALEALLDRGKDDPWAVYLHGPAGTGKTQQACEAIKASCRRRLRAYTYEDALVHGAQGDRKRHHRRGDIVESDSVPGHFPGYLATAEATMIGALRPDGGGQLATYAGAKLLVLDDLGTVKATEWVYEQLAAVIDHRYRHKLPTIFTSNVALDDLQDGAAYDARLATRIMQMCGVPGVDTHVVHMTTQYRLGVV